MTMPDQPYTEADVEAVDGILYDWFLEKSLDCWPDFEPAARLVLEHLANAGRLLPAGAEQREEWAVEWLSARGGIAMDRMRISSMEEAQHLGPQYVGQYNITSFRVVRRTWRHFEDGSCFAGPWVEVDGSTPA